MPETRESSEERATDTGDSESLKLEVTIFYKFMFDVGKFVNPTRAARRLLKKDFALSSANYSNETIEIAYRFKRLRNLSSEGKAALELVKFIKNGEYSKLSKWSLRHPFLFLRYLSYLSKEVLVPNKKTENNHETKKGKDAGLEDALKSLDESIIRIPAVGALQRDVDKSLFTPQYISEIPFSRVALQPFFTTIAGENTGIDVDVLIHRTGIAILTFYILLSEQKSINELANLRASSLPVETIEISAPILRAREGPIEPPSEKRSSGGVEWFTYKDLNKLTLMDMFGIYQEAVTSAVWNRKLSKPIEPWSWLRSWTTMAYPIIFVKRIIPSVLDCAEFKKRYPGELAALIMRSPKLSLKKEMVEKIIDDDLSIMGNYSLYANSGHTVCIYYESVRQDLIHKYGEKIPGQEWIYKHFLTSSIIDALLTQRWTLSVLSDQLVSHPANLKRINELKKEILLGLEEYHGLILSYGSAQDIIKLAGEKLGINDLHQNLLRKIDIINNIIEAEETDRRARSDLLVKFSAVSLTVFFGLFGLWKTVGVTIEWRDLISSVPEDWMRDTLTSFVGFIQLHSIAATLILYLVPIFIIIILFVWSFLFPSNRRPIINKDQSRPAHLKGFKWPVGIKIKHHGEDNGSLDNIKSKDQEDGMKNKK